MSEVDIPVTITRWFSDEPQPGMVEFEIVDRHGIVHAFQTKAPYVSSRSLWSDSAYPQPGSLRATLVGSAVEADLSEILTIDMADWVIGQNEAQCILEVYASGTASQTHDAGH